MKYYKITFKTVKSGILVHVCFKELADLLIWLTQAMKVSILRHSVRKSSETILTWFLLTSKTFNSARQRGRDSSDIWLLKTKQKILFIWAYNIFYTYVYPPKKCIRRTNERSESSVALVEKRSSYNIPLQRELFQFVRGLTQLEGEDGDLVEGEVELA